MYQPLPDRPPLDLAVGQRSTPSPGGQSLRDAVDAALREELAKTAISYRDTSPVPETGSAPPLAQPGIPPMDPHLTQIGRLCLYIGCATVPPGLVTSLCLWSTGHADPEALKWIAVAIGCVGAAGGGLALLIKGVVKAAPPREIHNHFEGPVYQDRRTVHTKTSGVWAKTNNNP
ncbi:hypothetical protein SMD44_00937 [Streptomyces alboflavus]|uniref:Uncharacterized protein n=1 Tax=Streptomyces alboflavus TaxID=67267 RepID=A0A1Z1W588_9ACTN|nr:hypothetical protein [Streptomyces alboflavus]ARX81539.1 hypothetical protein SMD44_00937 [Streptomyces alboflavus]